MRWCLLGCVLLLGHVGLAVASTLEVRAQPGVEVYWEGVLLDETDADGQLTVEDIPEGLFEIQLRRAGFRTLTTEVRVSGERTLLERRLASLPDGETEAPRDSNAAAPAAPTASDTPTKAPANADLQRSGATPAANEPSVKLSAGGWLMLVALLAMGAAFALRSLRARQMAMGPVAPAPAPEPEVPAEPAFEPPSQTAGAGDSFLDDLQQRERAWGEEGTPQASEHGTDESDVVDVVWKEVD